LKNTESKFESRLVLKVTGQEYCAREAKKDPIQRDQYMNRCVHKWYFKKNWKTEPEGPFRQNKT
jgi:hypothetical protein